MTLPELSIAAMFNSRRKFLYDLKVASEDEQEDALKEMERFCKLLDDEKIVFVSSPPSFNLPLKSNCM